MASSFHEIFIQDNSVVSALHWKHVKCIQAGRLSPIQGISKEVCVIGENEKKFPDGKKKMNEEKLQEVESNVNLCTISVTD